jgi:hypothetical protein
MGRFFLYPPGFYRATEMGNKMAFFDHTSRTGLSFFTMKNRKALKSRLKKLPDRKTIV